MKPSQAIRANAIEMRNPSRSGHEGDDALSSLLKEIVQTREARRLLGTLIPEVMHIWAGDGQGAPGVKAGIKKWVSRQIGKNIKKALLEEGKLHKAKDLQSLCESPEFLQDFSDQLPELLNGVLDVISAIGKNIDKLPAGQKTQLLDGVISGSAKGRTGELLTTYTRIINEIHQNDPTFFAKTLAPAFRNWAEKADFGEIKELLDNSAEDLIAIIKMANDVMWEYPAKVLLMMSFLPGIANIATASLQDTVMRFNNLSPDMITDIVLSFLREIDGQTIGRLINEINELIRKLSTGSALLGEPGNPLFPQDLSRILEDALGTLDGDLLWKARVAVSEGKASVNKTIVDALRDNPELLMLRLDHLSALGNCRVRAISRKMDLIEGLPEEDVADAVSRGISEFDAQEMGEILNLIALLANRIRKLKPELAPALVAQFVDSLDLNEMKDTIKWIVDDLSEALRPLARVFIPQLVKGFCGWLTPEDDDNMEEVGMAVNQIRSLLQNEELRS
jgi:hypothetical protein